LIRLRVRPQASSPTPRAAQPPPSPSPEAPALPLAEDALPTGDSGSALTPRRIVVGLLFTAAALVGMYFLLPKLAGLHQTWGQLKHGDPLWLVLGGILELVSIGGYVVLFRSVFGRDTPRIDWRVSVQIPLAGIAAIRLLAAAGAGGVAVTAWALRRAGMSSRIIACRMIASYILQYTVYLGALVVCGFGLQLGLFSGKAPFVVTLIPAVLSVGAFVLIAGMALVPSDFERRLHRLSTRAGRVGRLAARSATAPALLGAGVRTALDVLRDRRLAAIGALAYWGFDIATLGVCFHAFGSIVPVAVLVMGYFLGTLGSLLPLPGGVGGVEGGMIGAFVAFGLPGGRAVIAVLAYRAISFWLPTLPGVAGYVALRSTVRRWRDDDQGEAQAKAEAETTS
jgi:uncharacterized protein (TIRG00374 family)